MVNLKQVKVVHFKQVNVVNLKQVKVVHFRRLMW